MRFWSLSWEAPLEEGVATYSSILAWRTPWTEEPGRLESMGSHGVRRDWSDLAQHDTVLMIRAFSLEIDHIRWLLSIGVLDTSCTLWSSDSALSISGCFHGLYLWIFPLWICWLTSAIFHICDLYNHVNMVDFFPFIYLNTVDAQGVISAVQ